MFCFYEFQNGTFGCIKFACGIIKTQDILLLNAVRYFVCKPLIQLYVFKFEYREDTVLYFKIILKRSYSNKSDKQDT